MKSFDRDMTHDLSAQLLKQSKDDEDEEDGKVDEEDGEVDDDDGKVDGEVDDDDWEMTHGLPAPAP